MKRNTETFASILGSWFPCSAWEPTLPNALRRLWRRRTSQAVRSHGGPWERGKRLSCIIAVLILSAVIFSPKAFAQKKLRFTTPPDKNFSPITGWTREHIEEAFFVLMNGIVSSASEGGARQRIAGQRSHHGQLADELEGFSRSFIMASAWLHGSPSGKFTYQGKTTDVAGFYKRGILAGTDPNNPEYWGDIKDQSQHLCECAALGWSLCMSKAHIWDAFTEVEKKQVADYLYQCTKAKYYQNNWLLFNVITNAALKKLGMPYSQEQIDKNLQFCDDMYIGGGWYRDGKINRIDYYNAWGFLNYYMMWAILDGDSKPEMAKKYKQQTKEFVNDFQYFISGDGSVPCFGRSMIYRFGYLSPVVLGQYTGSLDLDPGVVRTMINMGMKFYFDQEILTDDDHLSMGFIRPNAKMLEKYSCGGSPYWAAKAFSILLLPKDDPFWKVREKPLPIQINSYSYPIKSAGFLLLGDKQSGHVQLINQKSYHDEASYNDKYTKFAYSSIFSYEAGTVYESFDCDNALQFSEDGILFFQRWSMENLYTVKDFIASKYPLYKVDDKGTGYTDILVKDDFMINFHQIKTEKSLVFKEGGYPLGFDDGRARCVSSRNSEAGYKDNKITYLRNLYGYTVKRKAAPYQGQMSGTNVRYRQSVIPVLGFENKDQHKFYLASMVYGKVGDDPIEKLDRLVKTFQIKDNTAEISFYDDERAFMQIGDIKDVSITLNGQKFSGPVVVARVSADKKKWFVLYSDGHVDSSKE